MAATGKHTHTHIETQGERWLSALSLSTKDLLHCLRKSIGGSTKGGGVCGGENDDPVNKRSRPVFKPAASLRSRRAHVSHKRGFRLVSRVSAEASTERPPAGEDGPPSCQLVRQDLGRN